MSVKLTLQLDTSMCLGPHSERALDESVLVECDGTALAIPVTAKVLAPQVRSTVAVGVCACVSVPVCLCLCVCACVSVCMWQVVAVALISCLCCFPGRSFASCTGL